MALRRERVTRSGAGEKGDGGVVVDLDPLSAFALMGQRTEGASASPDAGTGSNGSSSGGATTRSELQPSRQQQPSLQRPTGMESWNHVELNIPAPSSRVRSFSCFRPTHNSSTLFDVRRGSQCAPRVRHLRAPVGTRGRVTGRDSSYLLSYPVSLDLRMLSFFGTCHCRNQRNPPPWKRARKYPLLVIHTYAPASCHEEIPTASIRMPKGWLPLCRSREDPGYKPGDTREIHVSSPPPPSTALYRFDHKPMGAVETARRGAPGYPLANAEGRAHPITPSTSRPERRLSTMATPSPPRQLGVSSACIDGLETLRNSQLENLLFSFVNSKLHALSP